MTEKPSSLYILKRNIYLFVYSNNKSKLVSVTKGKGRDRKDVALYIWEACYAECVKIG